MLPILIVDDEPHIARLIEMTLEPLGQPLVLACDGEQAADLLEKQQFDLVLLDVMMPEMNGLEATRCIRAFEGKGPGEGTPIIAMTANVFADDVKACLDAGMNSHVGKPLDMKVLIGEILKYTDAC